MDNRLVRRAADHNKAGRASQKRRGDLAARDSSAPEKQMFTFGIYRGQIPTFRSRTRRIIFLGVGAPSTVHVMFTRDRVLGPTT